MRKLIISLFVLIAPLLSAQQSEGKVWADSVYATMTDAQRVGQLFMIRAHSDLGADHIASVKDQIIRYHVGGLCFFQGTPKGHAALINAYQVLSDIPLMVAMDAEWGGGMRFKDQGFSFPRQLMLGAIQDNRLIYEMGKTVGRQLRDIGVHVNFAPVADINNNALNPVIGDRSFGENKVNVTSKSYQYMLGLQDAGILPCAKHFPGHGDTDTDSHLDLPVIRHSMARLDTVELFPFQAMIKKGLPSLMVAHLHIPVLDSTRHLPTTLSRPVITDLLRERMQFDGLVFTDALEMKGVTKHFRPGRIELMAILAGNDVILLPDNIGVAVDTLLTALRTGRLPREVLEDRVKRILRSKYALGLTDVRNVIRPMDQIGDQVNDRVALALKEQLVEAALTVVSNRDSLIPVRQVNNIRVATLGIGPVKGHRFKMRTDAYVNAAHFTATQGSLSGQNGTLRRELEGHDLVIAGIHGLSRKADENFGVRLSTISFLNDLAKKTNLVVIVFGSPYAARYFADLSNVIVAYEDEPMIHDLAIQGVFGAFGMSGKLPVSASIRIPEGTGATVASLMRVGYSTPERVGIASDSLANINKIVEEMIKEKAAPGCQILIARHGKIIYERAFGYFTYDETQAVAKSDIYDLASITKVAASTVSLMKLVDDGHLCIDESIGMYLPESRQTNKENLRLTSILAHESGLVAWIPFYSETIEKTGRSVTPMPDYYQSEHDAHYCIPVADDLFMCGTYVDTIWNRVFESDLKRPGRYVYSDLGFVMFARMIEEMTGDSIHEYVADHFYDPMGLERLLFRPLERFPEYTIVPTEEDTYFRNQRIQGHVHDMGAAMMGGVSGHAGLFGNAHDLGVLMQMLMNQGYYGGVQYLSPEVVKLFAQRVRGSTRRGLGFDMKELDPNGRLLTSPMASDETYGHTGFTGTCAWNDPEAELVYIFLSNRTYPSMKGKQFRKGEYRQRVHTAIYQAITDR